MSQRNPMNDRYTLDKVAGTTRKSASSAKPMSKAASSVRIKSDKPAKRSLLDRFKGEDEHTKNNPKGSASDQRKTARQRKRAIQSFVPNTPEFARYNKQRMMLSAAGCVIIIVAILISLFTTLTVAAIVLMMVSWGLFCASIYIDTKHMRPIREREYARMEARESKKSKRSKA